MFLLIPLTNDAMPEKAVSSTLASVDSLVVPLLVDGRIELM